VVKTRVWTKAVLKCSKINYAGEALFEISFGNVHMLFCQGGRCCPHYNGSVKLNAQPFQLFASRNLNWPMCATREPNSLLNLFEYGCQSWQAISYLIWLGTRQTFLSRKGQSGITRNHSLKYQAPTNSIFFQILLHY